MPQRAKIYFDVDALRMRIENTPVEERLFELFTSKKLITYFCDNLVFKVRELSETITDSEKRAYFAKAIGKDHLTHTVRQKVLVKLFENSVDVWLSQKNADLVTIMHKLLDESLVYQTIDELSSWIQTVYKKIKK